MYSKACGERPAQLFDRLGSMYQFIKIEKDKIGIRNLSEDGSMCAGPFDSSQYQD